MHPARRLGLMNSLMEKKAILGNIGKSMFSFINRLAPKKQWGTALSGAGGGGRIGEVAARQLDPLQKQIDAFAAKGKGLAALGRSAKPAELAQYNALVAKLTKRKATLQAIRDKTMLDRQRAMGAATLGGAGLAGYHFGSPLLESEPETPMASPFLPQGV